MSYRDEGEILRERLRLIDRALVARKLESAQISTEEQRLRSERREIDHKLRARRTLPFLDDIRVASPCNESWSEMSGDDRIRLCGKCDKHVYDLSEMTRAEAERLLQNEEGNVCVRFYRRSDGTVLTADCPEGVKRRRARRASLIGAVAGASFLASTAVHFVAIAPTNRTIERRVAKEDEEQLPPSTIGSVSSPPPIIETIAPPPNVPEVQAPPTQKTTTRMKIDVTHGKPCICPPGVALCEC